MQEELNKLFLWSDGKSDDDILCQTENDSDLVVYHLLEDIKCLKEDNQFANALLADRERLIREMHNQVAGYLDGEEWEHWQKFNQDRFKVE